MDPTEQEFVKLEENLNHAIANNNMNAIRKLISDDWMLIDSEGHQIEQTRFLGVIKSGDLSHSSMESDEWRVRVYDETAIVTARVRSKGAWLGEHFELLERSTSIYIQQAGGWRCVFTQLTSLEDD